MEKRIFKYRIEFDNLSELSLPKESEVLTVQIDQKDNAPYLWALVDPKNKPEYRFFELFGTGHIMIYNMSTNRKYIGTFQYQNGDFVGHLFERIIE